MSTRRTGKFYFLLISIFYIISCTSKNNTITIGAFTKKYVDSLKQRLPAENFTIIDDSTIVSKFQKNDIRISVDNAYRQYLDAPDSLSHILSKYVSVTTGLYKPRKKITVDQIVPIIKPVAYLENTRRVATKMGAKKENDVEGVYEKYNDQLIIAYAADGINDINYLTQKDLKELAINKDSLRSIAKRNLDRIVHIQRSVESGVYMLTAGGDYEVSLILFDDLFTKENMPVVGDYVIAIPNRDLLLITGSHDKKGIEKLKELIAKTYDTGSYPVSECLYKWNGKIFEKYE